MQVSGSERQRSYRPGHPLALRQVLSGLRHGGGDPCCRWEPNGRALWWATGTPTGSALLHLMLDPAAEEVLATAWGKGADWVLDGVPELLGSRDRPHDFAPTHRVLIEGVRTNPGLRVMRTRRVFDAFAAACMEQRVTGKEAFYAWGRLVRQFGEPAPGPASAQDEAHPARGMHLPPTPEVWRAIPSWEWLQAGVDQSRRRTLVNGARAATGLERTLTLPAADVDRTLQTLGGLGRWTSAEIRQRAHGDADAFSFGDYHVAKNVSFALTGQVLDDDGCARLIEQYRGHRFRVQRLIELAGIARPRRGPRMALPTHTPTRQRVHRPPR